MSIKKLTAIIAATALGLGLTACGGDPTAGEKSAADTITVGSADFPENEIIAEIYAQALEAKGVKVKRQLRIGAREAYLPALQNGEVDLLPEYTGNLLTYLDDSATATAPDEVESALGDALPDNLKILDPSQAEDKDSLNVTSEYSEKNGVTSIGDLADQGSILVGGNPEFEKRSYGIPGMKDVYGIDAKLKPISDSGGPATVKALKNGKVDVADIFSTSPAIVDNDFVTLNDPKNMIAAQNVVPLINTDKDNDEITAVLNKISAELTTKDLLDLNGKNQGAEKAQPADLAKQWLSDKGIV